MAEALNPYRQWLGLDTDAERLNHYELLDLPLFEGDEETIHHAADRALARVRSHRPGAHAAAWAQLLDALAQAKACLSDPANKASYDNSLRAQQTAPKSDRPTPHSTSSDPEVASVNQLPDLFPPGMAPTTPAATQPKTPSAAATPSNATRSGAADAPNRAASKPQSKSPHKKPPPPPAPSSVVSRAGRLLDDPDEGTGAVISGISEPVPPAPINAHVAPPRQQQASMLPIIVGVVAVVVVITLLVVFLAMRGSLGGSMGGLSPEPAPAPAVKKSVTIAKRPAVGRSFQDPRVSFPPAASSTAANQKQQSAITTSGDATVNKNTGNGSSSAPAVTVQQNPGPQVAAGPNVRPPNRPETGAAGGAAVSATSPPTPTRADLVQLSRALTDVQFAVGQHDFERAKLQLRNANTLVTLPQHQALVARLQQLTDHSDRFWRTVASALRSFRGAEELQVGSSGLLVVVVEASPTSITVHKEGRNWRYTLTEMPPGLALAIAKTRLKVDEPADLLQLGACLATVADRKPDYLDEARKYWLQAQAAGADVDELLLTLTDSYDLAQ